jgi:hypothetical protein
MPTVAEYIEGHQQAIVDAFIAQASQLESARALPDHEVRDFLPQYLQFLAGLSSGQTCDADPEKTNIPDRHPNQRLQLGYHQEDVTTEVQLLARILFSLWEQRPVSAQPPAEDIARLSAELESAVDQVPAVFSGYTVQDRQAEKRYLRQLERLAREQGAS